MTEEQLFWTGLLLAPFFALHITTRFIGPENMLKILKAIYKIKSLNVALLQEELAKQPIT